jgi:hypothetical protein
VAPKLASGWPGDNGGRLGFQVGGKQERPPELNRRGGVVEHLEANQKTLSRRRHRRP